MWKTEKRCTQYDIFYLYRTAPCVGARTVFESPIHGALLPRISPPIAHRTSPHGRAIPAAPSVEAPVGYKHRDYHRVWRPLPAPVAQHLLLRPPRFNSHRWPHSAAPRGIDIFPSGWPGTPIASGSTKSARAPHTCIMAESIPHDMRTFPSARMRSRMPPSSLPGIARSLLSMYDLRAYSAADEHCARDLKAERVSDVHGQHSKTKGKVKTGGGGADWKYEGGRKIRRWREGSGESVKGGQEQEKVLAATRREKLQTRPTSPLLIGWEHQGGTPARRRRQGTTAHSAIYRRGAGVRDAALLHAPSIQRDARPTALLLISCASTASRSGGDEAGSSKEAPQLKERKRASGDNPPSPHPRTPPSSFPSPHHAIQPKVRPQVIPLSSSPPPAPPRPPLHLALLLIDIVLLSVCVCVAVAVVGLRWARKGLVRPAAPESISRAAEKGEEGGEEVQEEW
ncbi:hypothetical protein B0H11DRAFT_1926080 [Mycena galericulata]|nr:hypothetical protein B0H11DRAFT_1926080 [Mycena galericulata]